MTKRKSKANRSKLTDKQKRFIEEYLIDLNASQAAIRSGYSPKTANRIGTENLSKLVIQDKIQQAQQKRSLRTEITQDRVLKELALIGFSDMGDFITINEEGSIRAKPLDSLQEGKSRIIKKVKEKRTTRITREGEEITDIFYEFELHDKVKCLEMMGKHLGMFIEKQDDQESYTDKARKIRELVSEMDDMTNGPS